MPTKKIAPEVSTFGDNPRSGENSPACETWWNVYVPDGEAYTLVGTFTSESEAYTLMMSIRKTENVRAIVRQRGKRVHYDKARYA